MAFLRPIDFEPVDVPSLGTVFQTTFIIALAVFGLLNQLSGGIVAVGGDFAVPAGFLDQVVGRVVIETVGFAVFVGEDGQTAGFVVGVGEGMAQRVGAFERQSVHCEFVGGFGTESVDVGGQPVEAVVFEGFVTAVGIVGTDGVARCVVVVAGGMAQRIGDSFEIWMRRLPPSWCAPPQATHAGWTRCCAGWCDLPGLTGRNPPWKWYGSLPRC